MREPDAWQSPQLTLGVIIVTLLISAGVFPFGAVHPWTYVPLMVTVSACGGWFWFTRRVPDRVGIGAALLFLPIALQCTPLPTLGLDHIAPANVRTAESLLPGFSLDRSPWMTLSVSPTLSRVALAFLACGVLWAGGVSNATGRRLTAAALAEAVLRIGLIVALFALVQSATFNGKIYWFWESRSGVSNNYFGPFVNRNHFAGWMLLALSLGTGYFLSRVAVAGRALKPGWRRQLLWLGSKEASAVVLTGTSLIVMALSLVWSLSRSGIASAILALAMLAVAALVRIRTTARRNVAIAAVATLVLTGAAWKGVGSLAVWFGNTETLHWRFALWRDSLKAFRDFWAFGSGLNTYGQIMLLYPQTDPTVHAQQAHNDYLQLAIEGGLLVVVPWLVGASLLTRRIVQRLRQPQDETIWWIRMGAVAGICGLALQEMTEFSLQIPGVALLFATLVGMAIHEPAAVVQKEGRGASRTSVHRRQNVAILR